MTSQYRDHRTGDRVRRDTGRRDAPRGDAGRDRGRPDGERRDGVAATRELLGLALQGARANGRPDLLARLGTARRELAAATGGRERAEAVVAATGLVLRTMDTLECDLNARRAMLGDRGRSARLRAELDSAQARSDRFASAAKEWAHVSGDGFAGVTSDGEYQLRLRTRALLAELEQAIHTGDPGKDRDGFDAAARQRLVGEADQAYRRLHAGACAVSARVAALLGLPAPHPVRTLPVVPPQQLVAGLADLRPPRPATPVPARLMKLFMPCWAGVAMTVLASKLLGLNLPGWGLALLAVGTALTLGGAAATGERRRQLDRRRADAQGAARALVDEFQLALGKQLRDAARSLQQELRRVITAEVARIGPALAAELAAVRTSAETARRAPAELAAIDGDLASVEELRERARRLRRGAQARLDRPERAADQVAAGQVDAGQVDAGQVDAGQVDAGQVDADEVTADDEEPTADDGTAVGEIAVGAGEMAVGEMPATRAAVGAAGPGPRHLHTVA